MNPTLLCSAVAPTLPVLAWLDPADRTCSRDQADETVTLIVDISLAERRNSGMLMALLGMVNAVA